MQKRIFLCAIFAGSLILSSCAATDTSNLTESDPSLSYSDSTENTSNSDLIESNPSASSSSYTPMPSNSTDESYEYSDLSFLTEEQQELYYKALSAANYLFGLPDNLEDGVTFKHQTNGDHVVGVDGYYLYQNTYNEFSDLVHSIFTTQFITSLGDFYSKKFIDYNGVLAASDEYYRQMVEGCTIQATENFPDTFKIVSQNEDEIRFYLISHYDRNWNYADKDFDIFTIEYPIRMIKADVGWRIDEFHTTMYG